MTEPYGNRGIVMSGGTLSAKQLAVGDQAQAIEVIQGVEQRLTERGLQEVRDKLDSLLKSIMDERALEPGVLDATQAVAKELEKPAPNKLTLSAILSGIANAATATTTIGQAAIALKDAIMTLM